MAARIIDGKLISTEVKERIAAEVAEYVERVGRPMYFHRWLEESRGGTR